MRVSQSRNNERHKTQIKDNVLFQSVPEEGTDPAGKDSQQHPTNLLTRSGAYVIVCLYIKFAR